MTDVHNHNEKHTGHDHENHCCDQEHDHNHDTIDLNHDHGNTGIAAHWQLICAFVLLAVMLTLEYGFDYKPPFPTGVVIYAVAWFLSGYQVAAMAFRKARRFDFFNEFFLMTIATIGAFAIGSYSEGVAVMVFYSIGEWFQDSAVDRAKRSIKALLDIRPEKVTVFKDGRSTVAEPSTVAINEIIEIKPGEKVALDGVLLTDTASFNTAALTGESRPDTKHKGEQVLAGMINLEKVSQVQVTALFSDSKLSKILEMVQDATARKSQTQLFISRFAKIYTPIVFVLALCVWLLPYFFDSQYQSENWFYRSLVFLVISCPCALVVSIPLGYFGGIGLASRNGILFKGSNFLDVITKVNMVIMDKTGTLTHGVFEVQEIVSADVTKDELIRLAAALESNSTHPIAKAITQYAAKYELPKALDVEEIAGLGLRGSVDGQNVLAGNARLLKKFGISYPDHLNNSANTQVILAVNERYAGYITIADQLKNDAKDTVQQLQKLGLKVVMLSGDKQAIVDQTAANVGTNEAFGDLLPEGKVEKVQSYKDQAMRIAFAGDGVNDAPVVALADAGIAMGGLGSDATIETADIVIQNDQPSKIITAIKIGKLTQRVVWQNITIAMLVKIAVLILGAGGIANLWEAVISDVGVALVAILNAVRIQRTRI